MVIYKYRKTTQGGIKMKTKEMAKTLDVDTKEIIKLHKQGLLMKIQVKDFMNNTRGNLGGWARNDEDIKNHIETLKECNTLAYEFTVIVNGQKYKTVSK